MDRISFAKFLCFSWLLLIFYGKNVNGESSTEFTGRRSLKTTVSASVTSISNPKLAASYNVIEKFKSTISSDPNGITATWKGPNVCNYKGFLCDRLPTDNKTLAVASIDFNFFGLGAPTLEGFIDKFPDIAIFHINSNKFRGTIPDLSNLKYIYEIDASNNLLHGSFPRNVLNLRQLSSLDLRFNSFSGPLPSELFTMKLEVLFLNNNNFSQSLPNNLGQSPVSFLTLANNMFTGSIPSSIGKMSDTLTELLLLNNSFSGCLPYEIGLLHNARVFDASKNQLTGEIPSSFACLSSIVVLNLKDNQLHGRIPESVCALGKLANLTLANNYFTEIGPTCSRLMRNGILDVRNNCLQGLPYQKSKQVCLAFLSKVKSCTANTQLPCKIPSATTRRNRRLFWSTMPKPFTYSAISDSNPMIHRARGRAQLYSLN